MSPKSSEVAVRGHAGLRVQCVGSGACCRSGYTLGPIEDSIAAGLDAADVASWWPAAAEGWSETRDGPAGVGRYFKKVDGACIFLRPDQLCAVHAELGPEAKPAFCRLFPFTAVRDAKGVAIGIRPNCHSQHKLEGEVVSETLLHEVAQLAQIAGMPTFSAKAVRVLGGRGVCIEDWLHLETLLLDVARDAPRGLLARYRQILSTAMPGGWEPAVPERYGSAWRQVAAHLHRSLSPLAEGDEIGPRHERVVAVLAMLARALTRDTPAEIAPEALDHLHHQFRSAVLLKQFATGGSFAAGMGVFMLGIEVAAHSWPGETATAAAFGPPWAMWHDLLAHPAVVAMLRREEAALEAVFLNA